MRGSTSERRRMPSTRSAAVMVAGIVLLTALVAPATLAAAPNPSPGSVTVDGDTGDWSLGADFFADMTDAGLAGRPVLAKLYLRYDCSAEVLYALVLAQNGEKARQDRPENAYVRIDGSGKLIDGNDGNNGTPPDFAWVNGDGSLADGWEGSGSLAPGEYTIRSHVLIADGSADGYAPADPIGREVPLVIECAGVEPTPTPTPTPTPGATGGTNPTPTPGTTGGVAPTQGTTSDPTLPPTDTLETTETGQPAGIGLVLVLLGVTSLASLVLIPSRRRRPVTATVKESIERR